MISNKYYDASPQNFDNTSLLDCNNGVIWLMQQYGSIP